MRKNVGLGRRLCSKVLDMAQKGPVSIVTGKIPASGTFTLSEEMRGRPTDIQVP